ncbi:enkurin domain-containing protein 1-like [Daphnia carinata]|uniref:enkurin domain-containing protein 1-like n=1 Tax=Daphnia carinata TaxID=120202 RepID=UPI00257AA32F|nr:enkurin domain-containing protein 1-like [Daphnia carinata]
MDTLRSAPTPKFSVGIKERHSRIKRVLAEIRREKPLGKCPLFKMTLTFPSFVWSPIIDSVYSFRTEQNLDNLKATVAAPKKPLLRSHSTSSLKSTTSPETQAVIPKKTERKDVIRLNMLARVANSAIKMKTSVARSHHSELATQRSHKLGAIPKYLTSRKAEWAHLEEEKLKNMPDPDCPIGHVIMPESERLETLSRLQKSQLELNAEFNCLPLSKDSLTIRRKKEDLEKQLIKVEEGIRVLSKPKVFVRLDR